MWVNFKLMTAVSVGQFKIVVDRVAMDIAAGSIKKYR